jgi:hypothetical protein
MSSFLEEVNFLKQRQMFLHLFQVLNWGINHPVITLVILLFLLAIVWSILKRVVNFIEIASWSIFQFPWKLCQSLLKSLFLYLGYLANLASQRITGKKATDYIYPIITRVVPITYLNKQQRLIQISDRLIAIHKEEEALLKEAANLIARE